MNRASGDLNLLRKIKKLKQEVDNIPIVSGESSGDEWSSITIGSVTKNIPSKVSGESSDDNWSSITIDNVTKAIPVKTRVFRHKFEISVDSTYSAVIFLIDTIEAPITRSNYADRCSAGLITSRVVNMTTSPKKRYIIETIASDKVYFFNANNEETGLTITEDSVFHSDSILEL